MEFVLAGIFGAICATIYLLHINGYFELLFMIIRNIKMINRNMKKFNITPELFNQYASIFEDNLKGLNLTHDVINVLQETLLNKDKPKNKTYISESGKCIHIYYEYSGTEYRLIVPYSMLSSVDMIQYQMDAIYENGDILTITQQPGIPYLVNTNDLKCKTLKVTNHETDVYHFYKNDEIPNFCNEICDYK
jgi:hypothetical protein